MYVSDFGAKYSSNGQNYSDDGGDTELPNLVDDVGRNIQQIIRKTGLMQKLINQRTTLENETFERLQSEQKNANKLIKDTSLQFQILDNLQTTDFETARQKSIQQEKLKQNFSDALRNFQKVQKLVAEKEKTEVQRARALPIDGSHHKDDNSRMYDNQPQLQRQTEAELSLDEIREREAAIQQLESDIADVNEIFKDLTIMVHEQGETLDSIEANVETALTHVQDGNGIIAKAVRYQNKARKRKLILAIILLILVIALILIIYLTAK